MQHGYGGDKDQILKRLKRAEGQVRGLQRMVEDDTYCIDVLTQVSAATKALEAGANLPAIWAALATGRPVQPVTAAGGVRYSRREGDLRRALVERRGGLARDVAGVVSAGLGAVHSIGRWRDPAPALTQARRLVARSPAPG